MEIDICPVTLCEISDTDRLISTPGCYKMQYNFPTKSKLKKIKTCIIFVGGTWKTPSFVLHLPVRKLMRHIEWSKELITLRYASLLLLCQELLNENLFMACKKYRDSTQDAQTWMINMKKRRWNYWMHYNCTVQPQKQYLYRPIWTYISPPPWKCWTVNSLAIKMLNLT